jgi:two-component system, OmpR family, KDP operon response regulator KdpE
LAADDSILVIDDELQILRLLEITLNLNGYKVSEDSTSEGINTAASQNPPLILPDPGLPVIRIICF